MKSLQATMRIRLLASMAFMIALALGSFWVLEVTRRATGEFVPTAERSEPDFFVEDFNYVKVSNTGEASYVISGERLTHNPRDDSYDIRLPVVTNKGQPGYASSTVRAQRAHVNSDASKVHLYDDVHLDRPASPKSEHLHVTSDYMLVLPDDDVVQTDKAVKITLGLSRLTGVGMWANNATRELRLFSNVHGTYQAAPR